MIEQDIKNLMLRIVRLERQTNCQHNWNSLIACKVKNGSVVGILKFCEKCALCVINKDGLHFMDYLSFYQQIITSPGWYDIDDDGKQILDSYLKHFEDRFRDDL
jgi:hypothetical protein